MKITMTLPKTILNIVKVIQKRLEISPSKDKIFPFSAWDFRDENGDPIPKPVLKSGLRQLAEDEAKQTNVNTETGKHHKADEEYYITVGMILSLAQRAYQIFKSSEAMEKRQLLNFLLRNCQLQGKKLQFELKTPFNGVLQANKCSNLLRG